MGIASQSVDLLQKAAELWNSTLEGVRTRKSTECRWADVYCTSVRKFVSCVPQAIDGLVWVNQEYPGTVEQVDPQKTGRVAGNRGGNDVFEVFCINFEV